MNNAATNPIQYMKYCTIWGILGFGFGKSENKLIWCFVDYVENYEKMYYP